MRLPQPRLRIAFLLASLFLIPALEASDAPPQPASQPADVIITNARIYTVNPQQKWAEAIAVRGDRIIAVGDRKQIEALRGPATKEIDAQGRLLLPGFTDCHIHFLDGSLDLQRVQLDDAKTIAEIQRRVKTFAAAHPEQPWVLGRGWSYALFGTSALPNKDYLDEIIPDRPVYLESYDAHTWWANSKALHLASITRQTPDPVGGSFARNPKTGEPTGAIVDDAADAVVRRAIPVPTREEKLQALRMGLKEANRVGLVRIHVPGSVSVGVGDLQDAALLEELRRTGELTLRMYLAYRLEPPAVTADELQQIEEARRRYHDEWISAGAAKMFLDGVIESHTAAMLAPYTDTPSLSGNLLWKPELYKKAVVEFDRRGFQVFTHAIGDRAVRLALDAYEEAQRTNHTQDMRHRVEHIETVSAQDIPRFGSLGVIASFQPFHSYPDDDALKVWAPHVGPERVQRAWALHSVEAAGGVLAFGSDWPIFSLNPWPGVQNALTRQTTEGEPAGGWIPKERISLPDAIRGYTLNAALAGHREKTEGSLEPGKLADMIVLSQDLFLIEPTEIGKTEVLLTMVGGKIVYQSPNWKASSLAGKSATEKK